MVPSIEKLTFGRNACNIGIGQAKPTVTWRFGPGKDWAQTQCELRIKRGGKERLYRNESSSSVDVEWPDDPLKSRERAEVAVRVSGKDGEWSAWFEDVVEAALLKASDWTSDFITSDIAPAESIAKRPIYLRREFSVDSPSESRIYATALGVYKLEINGTSVSDHVLAPGWQAYNHRLHYQTFVVPANLLRKGKNVITAIVGEGWYAGRLTWAVNRRNIYGSEIGLRLQMYTGDQEISSDKKWEWAYGPILGSELYDGELFDTSLTPSDWRPVKAIPFPCKAELIAPEAPPIRVTDEIKPKEITTSPKGKKVIDFGQNLVGWVRILKVPKAEQNKNIVTLRFAEVLDKGEIGMRPLRGAKCTDTLHLSEKEMEWEPSFTTHGFRYVEVQGMDVDLDNFVGIVVHSDMERLGHFECSDKLISQLHRNVVWGLRGNFVGVPTDCPQRDERLGWTGDIQVFTPSAAFLYDMRGMLGNWLHDISVETLKDNLNVPPVVSPDVMSGYDLTRGKFPQSVWCDVVALSPRALYQAYGGTGILEELYDAMTAWIDKGVPRNQDGLWETPMDFFQYGDWLDPAAPPEDAARALTDPALVADAYLVGTTGVVAKIGEILGKSGASKHAKDHDRLRKLFQETYVTKKGRLASDSQTAYVLAIQWDLLDADQRRAAIERLVRLVTRNKFRIGTGFAGTPVILNELAKTGQIETAYRMLEEKSCPSWLYPITMGATTIWERWDSLLPDGSINPGEMTSFNHYALGSVADFLHTVVGGIRPLVPGWKVVGIKPQPGGSLTSAKVSHISPYGLVSCEWEKKNSKLHVKATVPPNTTAEVEFAGVKKTVGSGDHEWSS